MAKSLSALGLDGVRATTVLASLAANIDKLRENQKFSNEEFVKGTDLLTEFNKRTTAPRQCLKNMPKNLRKCRLSLAKN